LSVAELRAAKITMKLQQLTA